VYIPGGRHAYGKGVSQWQLASGPNPREFQFDTDEVDIERRGDEIILRRPVRNLRARLMRWLPCPTTSSARDGRISLRKRGRAFDASGQTTRTNICIYIARNRPTTVARRFARAAPGSLGISIITWGELCFGAAKSSDPPRAHSLLEQFSSIVAVLPLSAAAGRHYGLVRAALERAGTPSVITTSGSQRTHWRWVCAGQQQPARI